MNEAQSLTGGYPHKKTSGAGFEKIEITEPMDDATKNRMIKNFRAAGWDAKPNNGGGITAVKKSMMEAKEEGSYEVIWTDRDYKKHSKVFKNDPKGAPDNAKKKAEAFKKALEDKDKKSKDGLYRSIDLNETKKEDAVDTITMDIPLFLRMLEYSREDASQDMDLHDVTEKANTLGKEKGILSMEDYDEIVGAAEDAPKGEVDEAELTEAYVPSNIKEFAKRKGVSSLVNKVAGWAEKVGKGIRGGTAIGKNYSTLILDMTYQGGEISINTDNDKIGRAHV